MATRDTSPPDARPYVDSLIARAMNSRASDFHIEPIPTGYQIRLRIDGMLYTLDSINSELGEAMVNCMMVMGKLVTYRKDIPQEGRITFKLEESRKLELRLAVMPTVHGLRAVVRMPADLYQPQKLSDLMLPPSVVNFLESFAHADNGLLAVVGPAGSGKTTVIYTLLEHMARTQPGLSIVSLEDPIERTLKGVTQIEIKPQGQMDYHKALRSMMRQDPQVLFVGEVRDAETASITIQAALTGHRLLCTMHAGSPLAAFTRLLEMGIQRYQIISSIYGLLIQRLVRRTVNGKYSGRMPVAQFVRMNDGIKQALVDDVSTTTKLEGAIQSSPGYFSLKDYAAQLVARGYTDQAEVQRVLGAE
ncbi:MAG TPA: ATPase, T2SS/T4P/T4SS family [Phycisphaerae bacterium]|nr:ATPase, T2SS/T4P/T4SS family [Phycisphaerae bacterium]